LVFVRFYGGKYKDFAKVRKFLEVYYFEYMVKINEIEGNKKAQVTMPELFYEKIILR